MNYTRYIPDFTDENDDSVIVVFSGGGRLTRERAKIVVSGIRKLWRREIELDPRCFIDQWSGWILASKAQRVKYPRLDVQVHLSTFTEHSALLNWKYSYMNGNREDQGTAFVIHKEKDW